MKKNLTFNRFQMGWSQFLKMKTMVFVFIFCGFQAFAIHSSSAHAVADEGEAVKVSEKASSQQQEIEVTGQVTDAETDDPLPGVNIVVEGTTTGATTDMDGNYSMEVPADATLQFSFVGYQEESVEVDGREQIDVNLQPEAQEMEEIVVVGYGNVEAREKTSSAQTINSEDFMQGAVNNTMDLVDGKMPGLTLSNPAAADPNNPGDLQIRGASSLEAGNNPLIVVDGVPGVSLQSVSEADIKSISTLKDASAAAIYGSRGADGVILIETHEGKRDEVSVDYSSYFEHDRIAAQPNNLSADEYIERDRGSDMGAETDWYNELVRKDNSGQRHNLRVAGGSENTVFSIAANYKQKEAIDIASEREEYGLRGNFEHISLDSLLEFSGNFSYKNVDVANTNYGVFNQAVKLNPTLPVMDEENESPYNYLRGHNRYNPVQDLETRINGEEQTYSTINFNTKLNLTDDLNTELKLSRVGQDAYPKEYYSSDHQESLENDRKGRARLENQKWADWTVEWLTNYRFSINDHNFRALGGYSYQEQVNKGFYAENMDFPSDVFEYHNLDAGDWNREEGRLGMGSWKSKEKTIGFFGRLNYDFDDTYLFTGSLRYEGNTKFGPDRKWGLFPSASAAWRISNLPALDDAGFINDMKVRFSYGETGRSGFDRYVSLARYDGFGYYPNSQGEWVQGYGPENNPNYELKWERQIEYNLGVDFSLFDEKVNGNIDGFVRRGKDILSNYEAPVPPYLHTSIFTNVGSTSAKGIEMDVSWNVINQDEFNYTTNLTGSYSKTKLESFSNDQYEKDYMDRSWLPAPGNPGYAQRLEEDTEVGSFYGYKYAGVNDDGDIMVWENGEEGSTKINASEVADESDEAYIGNGSPNYYLTWENSFNYKSFDLSFRFQGQFDYQVLNLQQMYYGLTAEPEVNLLEDAYDRNAHIKSGKVITDYFLEDGDYLKMDNITLGWTPDIESQWINNLRVYGSIQNVFTITGYSGLDPSTVGVTGLDPGVGSLDVYPITRNFTLGLQLSF
ncbi:MAG: SusC/RagA family TonB-linked outer membrane protein [Bacteroidales bacterium]